jgi:hypothetical protein
MNRFRYRLIGCSMFLAAVVCHAGQLWAQAAGTEPETQAAWVVSYALVILSVGLGLFVICRPGRRNKKVKAEKS